MLQKINYPTTDPLMNLKMSDLGERLGALQRELTQTDKSLLILISGWEAVGKGRVLNDLARELDPRYYRFHQFGDATEADRQHPLLWRFFQAFPEHGRVAIFDHSYYRELFFNPDCNDGCYHKALRDINFIEKLLTDDGCMVVKFFIDITEDGMQANIEALENDKNKRFLLTDFDKYQLKHYNRFRKHFTRVLTDTSTLTSPWHILNAGGKKVSREALTTLIRSLEWHLSTPEDQDAVPLPPIVSHPLDEVDLSAVITEEEYKARLKPLQAEAAELTYLLYRHHIPTIAVFEGSDAAGKGGCIRRLTRQMDPRSYMVATTSAPSKYELSHHYLWRFYQTFPLPGHLTIYDRSWYGRVMVERIEGFASPKRWQAAYKEINDMEESLVEDGYLIIKYLLVIDKDTQLARFQDRQNNPSKNYKITDEDWRNREKFDAYTQAMNDMLVRTSTVSAPWTVIPSVDKPYARIRVLETFIQAAKEALQKKGLHVKINVQKSKDK